MRRKTRDPRIELLPRPRSLERSADVCALPRTGAVVLCMARAGEHLWTAQRLAAALGEATGGRWSVAAGSERVRGVSLGLDAEIEREGYRLTIGPEGVAITGGAAAGLFYGMCTLIQLLETHGSTLPGLRIDDAPELAVRGVMLDISRDKVPTRATLEALIDQLASWKINQFQLYTEHTFAYPEHEVVWRGASPMTAQDILELDAFCRQRHVELVPNQNSFGHMERWFEHPRYRRMAETEGGVTLPWGEVTEHPFTLSPAHPQSRNFLAGLYDALLPNFSSTRFNVGCDETFDLGTGQSRALVEASSRAQVWLEFVKTIRELAAERGRTIQVWGDILRRSPKLLDQVPKDITVLDWGYEQERSLGKSGKKLAKAGLPFILCPGTSSWTTIAGRTDNAVGNILNAVESAHRHGAEGVLLTDWGDCGHWQHLSISQLPLAWSAALCWSLEANRKVDVPALLDRFVFRDSSGVTGRLAWDLGNAYLQPGFRRGNSSMLFWFYVVTVEYAREHWMTRMRTGKDILASDEAIRERMRQTLAYVDEVMAPLSSAEFGCEDGDLVRREFSHAAAMLRHSARRVLWQLGASDWSRGELQQELDAIESELMALWLARNRSGGLHDSLARLRAARNLHG